MTGLEMQNAFGVELNQLDDRLRMHSDDIYFWLNAAQNKMVDQRFRAEAGAGFERTVGLTSDLRPLVVRQTTIVPTLDADAFFSDHTSYLAALPANFMHLISLRVTTSSPSAVVAGRIAQQDDLFRLLEDPFNKTRKNSPLCFIDLDGIRVSTDGTFTVTHVYPTYLRKPATISGSTNSELPENLHHELVSLGVSMFLLSHQGAVEKLKETPIS